MSPILLPIFFIYRIMLDVMYITIKVNDINAGPIKS